MRNKKENHIKQPWGLQLDNFGCFSFEIFTQFWKIIAMISERERAHVTILLFGLLEERTISSMQIFELMYTVHTYIVQCTVVKFSEILFCVKCSQISTAS